MQKSIMKIASNTPASFRPRQGYEFFQLGDGVGEVTVILLMLERNWGGGNVDKINALTHYLSSYPEEVPCYIIGCESVISDDNISRYRDDARDYAVRELCSAVLKRSKSIGVRGDKTYNYLVKEVGLLKHQVDLIYDPRGYDNSVKLQEFLKKNSLSIGQLENDILKFQSRPYVLYERPIEFESNIIISQPYITEGDNSVRLNADVRIDGKVKNLWCETDIRYREFLLSERSDAFLCAILPLAMRIGKDIVCQAPVTEQFLHNISEILVPQLCAHDSRLFSTKVIAEADSTPLGNGRAVGTGMSCGVDSFYTTALYKETKFESMRLTHLYCGNYLYGNDGVIYERAELTAREFGLPLVRTATNINEELKLPHLYTHFYKTMFGVLALRKLFNIYYYSSSSDFGGFSLKDNSVRASADLDLLLLYVFSCSDFQVVSGGGKSNRLDKTRTVCSLEAAHKFLNVCLHPRRKRNCGKCEKCMRTLLIIDMLGSLYLFKDVFDIDEYSNKRIDSFVYLVRQKGSPMLSEVYEHFKKLEPLLIEEAERKSG